MLVSWCVRGKNSEAFLKERGIGSWCVRGTISEAFLKKHDAIVGWKPPTNRVY